MDSVIRRMIDMVRILKHARASDEAIQAAKTLYCPTCDRHQKTQPPRAAAPPRTWQVNQVVGVDTVWLPYMNGKQKICCASRFQLVVPLAAHTAGEARRAYLQWVRFMGPPTRLYVDLGKEFEGAFQHGTELDSTYIEPSALEMPTQRSVTERAGKNYKEIFAKTLDHYTCNTHDEWMSLVDVTTMVCNRLMNKSGYSPIQRVLGYTPRIPGGLHSGGDRDLASMSRVFRCRRPLKCD